MFSSSVRRIASSAPPSPAIPSFSSVAPRAAASLYRCHQRRSSSSKPSSPADGSKGIAEGQAVPAAPAKARPEGEAKPRSTKKKAKDVAANSTVKGRDESMLHLPSVPSTQHIAPLQLSASAFFSLYRPMSPTNSFPKPVTEDAFAAIFTPRVRSNKPTEVIDTLSNALKTLDDVTGKLHKTKLQDQWNEETDEVRAAITAESYRRAEVEALDNTPEDMSFPRHILSTKYRPFQPPSAPVPANTAESLAAGAEAAEEALEPQHRTYTAVLTIEESTDANGDVTYMAHSSPLVAEEPPATPTRFLERMQIRQERYREQRSEENDMLAISVKRIRKLKMKKHKYKKLMRRTRNLRRKLDRN